MWKWIIFCGNSHQDANADYNAWTLKIFSYSNPIILNLIVFKKNFFFGLVSPQRIQKPKL